MRHSNYSQAIDGRMTLNIEKSMKKYKNYILDNRSSVQKHFFYSRKHLIGIKIIFVFGSLKISNF
jgi:hypothetical protein